MFNKEELEILIEQPTVKSGEIVYHGTKKGFDTFETVETDIPVLDRQLGTHFAADKTVAQTFAEGEGGRVITTKLKFKKPYDLKQGKSSDQWAFQRDVADIVFPRRKDLFVEYWSKQRNLSKKEVSDIYDRIKRGEILTEKNSPSLYPTLTSEAKSPFGALGDNYGLLIFDKKLKAEFINEYKKALKEQGYDVIRYQNTSLQETGKAKDKTTYIPLSVTEANNILNKKEATKSE